MPKKSTVGEELVITAQQSRFDLDAVDAPTSREIWVKDLSISVGQKEILNRAEFRLKENTHYVLIGRNGTGKSTILKAVAEGRVPGIPWSTKILLLGQTRELGVEDGLVGLNMREESVLEYVVRSDKAREGLMLEAKTLSEAIEHNRDSLAAVRAYRKISHARLEKVLEEQRLLATRRSGARGKKAREELIKLEEQVSHSQARLDLISIDATAVSQETNSAIDLLAEVQSRLEMINADAAEAKARKVLLGLGFKNEQIQDSVSKLSGGWQTRCEIACALCQEADVLFLDEPTNFLDLPSIIWLQNHIRGIEDTTVVCVTHDRDFADAVANELLVLRNQKLEVFKGNLSLYESERIKRAKWMTDMKEAQEKQTEHFHKTVQNLHQAARRSGDDKKLKQATSRQKRIEERSGMQVNAKGHRFKLNRDAAGYHLTNRSAIDVPDFDPPVRIKIPDEPPDLRFPGSLVNLEEVSFSYPKRKGRPARETLKSITLTIHPGERVALCGLNGSGKTTLVSVIMGAAEEFSGTFSPSKGTINRHPRAKFARFSQQVVEELETFGAANPGISALRHLMDCAADLTERDARAVLGGLGLQGSLASDVPISALSGGQKVRLALAKLLAFPPHLLVLDEVTTHLDVDTIHGLIMALRSYKGALLIVTHDRHFCRCVVEGEHPARMRRHESDDQGADDSDDEDGEEEEELGKRKGVVYRMFRGELRVLEGGMDQYEEICERASLKLTGLSNG